MMNNRRNFLKQIGLYGGAFALAGKVAQAAPDWKKQIGLEVYTVRDLMAKDYEGTLAKVAEIGYKEIEPAANGYGNMEPKQFRAMLDRLGLTMPSTHVGATDGPGLEKELEGFQIMGLKYVEVSAARSGSGGGGAAKKAKGGAAAPPAPGADAIKRTAEQLNKHGEIVKKFGMKMLYHNHAPEFQPFEEGGAVRPYDILLKETDPALVAMQLDIGWATVAGQNVLEMFKNNPGRFELWHVKDARGIKNLPAGLNQRQRMNGITLVPVGEGEVNCKPIFAQAELAGMKHFCIEQDNAADWGDSMAAAKVSFQNLNKILG
jgi:sugar phosphate isomerase/epimerase